MTNYLSWALWGCFGLIVLLTIFGLLAGLCKGLVKTTVKTVLKAILITVFVFTSPLIARSVGNIDFSGFKGVINVGSTAVPVTSLVDTLANVLTATGLVSPMNGIAIYDAAIALSYSILSYVVFLVLMIVTQILISLVTCIIYNVFIRWLLPSKGKRESKEDKTFRKQNKALFILVRGLLGEHKQKKLHRGSAAVLGAVQEFVFACILLMPITSISRIAINSTKSKPETDTSTKSANNADLTDNYGSLYQALVAAGIVKDEDRPSGDTSTNIIYRTDFNTYVNQIENSFVYKMLGVGNMDNLVMDKVSVTTVNGVNMPLSEAIEGTFDAAYPLLNSKAISFDSASTTITINYTTLLATTTVDNVITAFAGNKIMMSLLTPLIDTALNYASAASNLPLDQIDLSNINWADDLKSIKDVYSQVYDSGIKPMISANKIDPSKFDLKTSTMSDSEIENLGDAVSKLCEVKAVKNNMSVVFSNLSLLLRNTGFDMFPADKESYSDVTWSSDMKSLVVNTLKLFRLCNLDLNYELFNNNKNLQFSDNQITKAVKSVLKDADKRAKLNTLLTGQNGLFTLSLLNQADLGTLVDSAIDLVPSLKPYTLSNQYKTSIESLNRNPEELRQETDVAFRLMDILFDKDQPLNYWDIKDISKNINDSSYVLSYLRDDVCGELINILDTAKQSEVFKSMYGPIMKSFVFQFYDSNKSKEKDYFFGLTPYDFNFEDADFLTDLKGLITLSPKLKKLYDNLNNNSLTRVEQLEALDTDTLRPFLNIAANSKLLNSDKIAGATGKETSNINVQKVLTKLFSMNPFNKLNIEVPDLSKVTNWGDGTKHKEGELVNGEIDALCSIIEDVQKNKELFNDLLNNRTKLNRDTLKLLLKDLDTSNERNALFDLLSDAYQSEVIRPTALEVSLKMADKFLSKYNIPYSLNDLRNYVYDEKNNTKIVEDIKNLKDLVPLLNTINYHCLLNDYRALRDRKQVEKYYFQTIDLDTINAVVTAIVKTNTYQYLSDSNHDDQTFDGRKDILCEVFYALCKKFNVFDRNRIIIPDFSSQVLNPMTYGEGWSDSTTKVTLNVVDHNWDNTDTKRTMDYDVTRSGAIMSILQGFKLVQDSDISTLLHKHMPTYHPNGFLASDGSVDPYFNAKALANDRYFRNLIYIYGPYVLEDAINYIDQLPAGSKRLIDYINWDLLTDTNTDGSFVFSSEDVIKEATTLFEFAKGLKKLGLRNLKDIAKNLNRLTPTQLSTIQDMIKNVADSKLLTSTRRGKNLSLVSKAASSLVEYAIQKKPRLAAGLRIVTLDDNSNTNIKSLEAMLKSVDEAGWKNELSLYADMLGAIQGIAIKDTKNLYAAGRNYTNLHTLSELVNRSSMLHKAPIGAIKVAMRKLNLNQYLEYDLDLYHHLTTSNKDVEYWQKVYDTALDLVYNDEGFRNLVGNDLNNLKDIKIDETSTSFLYYLGNVDLMKSNRSYFVYNAIVKVAGEDHVKKFLRKADNAPEGENAYAYQIENLFFQNQKLFKNGKMDKALALADTKKLDAVLKTVVNKISAFKNATNIDDIYNAIKDENGRVNFFTELTSDTITLDENGTLVRGDFASELVAGIIETMLSNSNLSDELQDLKDLDFYAGDYKLVNPIEGKAIDTLIELLHFERQTAHDSILHVENIHINETTATIGGREYTIPARVVDHDVKVTDWTYYTKAEMKQFYDGLCYHDSNYTRDIDKKLAKYFKETAEYQKTGNSKFAEKLADINHIESSKEYTADIAVEIEEIGVTVTIPVTGRTDKFVIPYLTVFPLVTDDNKAIFMKDRVSLSDIANKSLSEIFAASDLSDVK